MMRQLNGPPFYRLAASLEQASAALGITEPPAMIGFRGGEAQTAMEADAMSPENAEALVEALANDHL